MTSRDFCYWLQGLFELGKPTALDAEQTESVKRHLAMVFLHEIDPSAGDPAHQAGLQKLHDGLKKLEATKQPAHDPMAHTRVEHPDDVLIRC